MKHDDRLREAFDYGYNALGKVVYHFQELESELAYAISFHINSKDRKCAEIVVSELSFKQLTNIGYSLVAIQDLPNLEDALKEWRKIMGLCLKAEEHRNRLLHSNYHARYVGGPDNMEFIRFKRTAKMRKGVQSVEEELNHATVTKYLSEIAGVSAHVNAFMALTFPGWDGREHIPA